MIYKFETNHCPMCKRAEMLLKKHNVNYESVDAEESEYTDFYGIQSVPCLIEAEKLGEKATKICRTPQDEKKLLEFL